ncbi:MAG: hypothetical protein MZV64_44700 [Ignavibacteriales bacterium]|nr:hypothetical protein [Ignavibacteriales bacterium]
MRLAVVELDHRPLAADREGRAAVAQQAGGGDFLGDVARASSSSSAFSSVA